MIFIGIDPGKTGGITAIGHKGELLASERFDSADGIDAIGYMFHTFKGQEILTAMEMVHAYPGQGVVSMFTFGEQYGLAQGYLRALKQPFTLYPPQAWQKILPPGMSPKARVREYVTARLGNLDKLVPHRCKLPHQGMLDSFAISDFLRLVETGQIPRPIMRAKVRRKRLLRLEVPEEVDILEF